jgi:GPI ethanolamine phosphate transferase 2/3 subunit F
MTSVRKALKNIASGNRHRRLQPPSTSDDNSAAAAELELISLPNALPKQYPPLILIHVILLAAALLLLPQTPIPNLPLPPPARGLDKPQHPFLAPITARPALTLVWACLGAVLLVPWWAGSLRRWAHDGTLGSRSAQQRLAGDPHKQRVRPVLPFCFCTSSSSSSHAHPQDIRNACVFTAYAALALHVAIILFGAPFFQCVYLLLFLVISAHSSARCVFRYMPNTALLALLLALYTIFPPAYVLGPPRLGLPLLSAPAGDAVVQNDLWVRIFAERE